MADNLRKSVEAMRQGKIIVAVMSNDAGFEKLVNNPLYSKFFLRHVKTKADLLGLNLDFGIITHNPGMELEDGTIEKISERGKFIYNKAYLFELAKELEQ